jgi:hypothetical protein
MATAGGTGGKSTRLAGVGAGGPVDTSRYAQYGEVTGAAYQQPFWDLEKYDESPGPNHGQLLGITGDVVSSNPWDVVVLNGHPLPGLWVAAATPALQLDVQKPNGYDGAALVEKGYVPAGITMTGRIWTPGQWASFQVMIPTFWRAPNKWALNDVKKQTAQMVPRQLAVSIYYPGLAPFLINDMVIYQITPPEDTDQLGVKQIKILARQYIPAPQKQQTANRKINGIGSKDRTVQAAQIAAAAAPGPVSPGTLRAPVLPPFKTDPIAPSLGQSGFKLPSLPNYAKH